MQIKAWLFFIIVAIAAFSKAHASGNAAWLVSEIGKAKKGAVLTIPDGEYDVTDLKIRKNLTLMGKGAVVLFSSRTTAKGILNPLPFVSLHVENITFRGAVSRDQNGAGIRHDGRDLTVVNCRFIDNENGILATGDDDGAVRIENSEFIRNGHGDGYSHGIYLSSGKSLSVENSRFIGTKIGHHIKSLAKETIVTDSTLDDDDGRTSYSIDASRGGAVTVAGNTIIQSASSDNAAIINYDLTRGGDAKILTISNNKIINRHRRGVFLRNDTKLTPIINDNDVTNENGGRLDMGKATPKGASALDRLKGMLTSIREERETSAASASASASSPTPISLEAAAPSMSQKPKLIKAPMIKKYDNALFSFRLENNTAEDSAADYLTFAHPLPPGALTSDHVVVHFGGDPALAQMDVKARHADGSVRHAIFTIATPPLKAGAYTDGAIIEQQQQLPSPPVSFDAKAIIDQHYEMPVSIAFHNEGGEPRAFYTNARTRALSAAGKAQTDTWLDGPLVKSFRIEKAAAPHLQLRLDISIYRDGDMRTSIAFANDKTFSAGKRDLTYDVIVGDAEEPVFLAENIVHHRSSVWRRVFWSGAEPRLHVVYDFDALAAAGAVLPLDQSIGIRRDVIADYLEDLRDAEPLSTGLLEQYFPQGGGRAEIGIYPQWTANYLVTQDQGAKVVMLANAEAGGAVPWHFRNERTNAPIRIDQRKKFWADERGLATQYAPDRAHPDLFDSNDGGWTVDHAHKPDLGFIPYLVTGDRYYADLVSMQAAYAIFGRWPDLREGGLKAIDVGQVRASAWSLRDISNAAYILPENDPLKEYFKKTLSINLSAMAEKYVTNRASKAAGELEGYFDELVEREPERISPWQNDFMTMALWQTARQHHDAHGDSAEALLAWASNFQAGRFLTSVFDIKRAPAYVLAAKIASTQEPRTNWEDVALATFGPSPSPLAEMEGYPNYAAGYIGSAYGTLAAIASETKSLVAYEAFATLAKENRKHGMWRTEEDGGAARNNGFIFSLALRNGAALSRNQFFKKNKDTSRFLTGGENNETMNGGGYGDLIIGFNGKDVINGAAGDDDLFGGKGDDTIEGGDDDDRLVGGNGNDTLTGGSGADLFAFRISETGDDHITDFDPQEDVIGVILKHGDAAPDAKKIAISASDGVLLKFSENSSVLLHGVSMTSVTQDHIKAVR